MSNRKVILALLFVAPLFPLVHASAQSIRSLGLVAGDGVRVAAYEMSDGNRVQLDQISLSSRLNSTTHW